MTCGCRRTLSLEDQGNERRDRGNPAILGHWAP